ncbi:MAG: RpiB/LacA/LacB family sugar-phosphate isomerase, partial [Patescibacteria group bacterium]|nr:RpiB/LacA/LacB family sugar-phosphate isomerase [Patescibacteria group bacterium]
MKIFLGADHAGFKLKEQIKKYLEKSGHKVLDEGALKYNKKDDYPDFAAKVAKKVKGDNSGVLVCGSSHGVCIAANKFKGVRAVAVSNTKDAKLTRQHNDANVLCLSGWDLSLSRAKKI